MEKTEYYDLSQPSGRDPIQPLPYKQDMLIIDAALRNLLMYISEVSTRLGDDIEDAKRPLEVLLADLSSHINALEPTTGSGTNSEWVRYPDGTQIVWAWGPDHPHDAISPGGVFTQSFAFPQTFKTRVSMAVFPSVRLNNPAIAPNYSTSFSADTVSNVDVTLGHSNQTPNTTGFQLYVMVVGRWK